MTRRSPYMRTNSGRLLRICGLGQECLGAQTAVGGDRIPPEFRRRNANQSNGLIEPFHRTLLDSRPNHPVRDGRGDADRPCNASGKSARLFPRGLAAQLRQY